MRIENKEYMNKKYLEIKLMSRSRSWFCSVVYNFLLEERVGRLII